MKKEKEMSFLDHLEELRWHIIRSLLAIVFFSLIAFFSKSIVFGIIILGPSKSDFWTYLLFCDIGKFLYDCNFCRYGCWYVIALLVGFPISSINKIFSSAGALDEIPEVFSGVPVISHSCMDW